MTFCPPANFLNDNPVGLLVYSVKIEDNLFPTSPFSNELNGNRLQAGILKTPQGKQDRYELEAKITEKLLKTHHKPRHQKLASKMTILVDTSFKSTI